MVDAIRIVGDRLSIRFDRFGLDMYDLFLRVKRLPEQTVTFDPADETYTVTAPARFAPMLGVALPQARAQDLPLLPALFDDQAAIVRMVLDAKRFAVWSDCGLGKMLILLESARHVIHRTGGRVLITTLNELVQQTIDEAAKFYGDSLPIVRITSRQHMRDWCRDGGGDAQLAVVNYEKWNPDGLEDQTVNEARHLAGFFLDEASRLKGGGGVQKWAIIHSSKGVEYKLACTATPAPNDVMEFASQASFLEKLRDEGEIIWTYFTRDATSHRWTVKPHARAAFFEFMSGWSIYVRNPKRYGWRLDHVEVPAPTVHVHEIPMTDVQREHLCRFTADQNGQMQLPGINDRETNAIERSRLSQVAKGFRYRKGEQGKFDRIESRKPAFVADLIRREVEAGYQVLVWTVFDAESKLLAEHLAAVSFGFDLLTGKTKDKDREAILERFVSGQCPVLISRASMLGYGKNFQCCRSMIFSGWSDSWEAYYQAVRRAYRHGQLYSVRVHLPVIPELESDQLDNLFRKEGENERSVMEMESNYIRTRLAWEAMA